MPTKKSSTSFDVTFDLTDGSYKPYMKPNNKLSYVHRQSNHPPALLKNKPLNINKRLTNISCSKEVFYESIAPYQHALKESGYDHKLTYNPEPPLKNKRKRKRDIMWYNPPFDSSVKTNLGRKFLHIVEKCFQNNHPLYKIFNRHTLKLSYSCMPNMKSIISSHTFFQMRHSNRRNETELSKHVWNLQDAKKPFQINWKILKKCRPYSNITKKCSLCLNEKLIIMCKKELCSLNRRNELASSCPHRNRYVLRNFRVT